MKKSSSPGGGAGIRRGEGLAALEPPAAVGSESKTAKLPQPQKDLIRFSRSDGLCCIDEADGGGQGSVGESDKSHGFVVVVVVVAVLLFADSPPRSDCQN